MTASPQDAARADSLPSTADARATPGTDRPPGNFNPSERLWASAGYASADAMFDDLDRRQG